MPGPGAPGGAPGGAPVLLEPAATGTCGGTGGGGGGGIAAADDDKNADYYNKNNFQQLNFTKRKRLVKIHKNAERNNIIIILFLKMSIIVRDY